VGSALAGIVTFNIEWSGASFGNSATATGFITFDDTVLPEIGAMGALTLPSPSVIDLGVTISGASAGNGSFGIGDFGAVVFETPSALDLSQELIGQLLTNGCTFGTSEGPCGDGLGGDFNLFGLTPDAPIGVWYFVLETAGGEAMLVTSMRPAGVPVPLTFALLGLGLVGMGLGRRKAA
jgi:hypothetical protein